MSNSAFDYGVTAPACHSLTLFPADCSDLTSLAAAINAAHSEAQAYASKAVERALVAGDLLLRAKAQCHHGQWLGWLKEHCPAISAKTASNWMRLAKEKHQIGNVADLTIRGALELLNDAKPGNDDPLDRWLSSLITDSRFPIGSIGWLMDIPPAVIFLDAIGWNKAAISERVSISERVISAILDPQPFERPDLQQHQFPACLDYLAPVIDRCQREYHWHVAAHVAERQGFWCKSVSTIARKFDRSDLAERFAGMERVYFRESERAYSKIPEWRDTQGQPDESDLLLIGAFIAANVDSSLGFTGSPPEYPDLPVARFIATLWVRHFDQNVTRAIEANYPAMGAMAQP